MGTAEVRRAGTVYRVALDGEVVCRLRERAARETLAKGSTVTWADILRRAASMAAAEGGSK